MSDITITNDGTQAIVDATSSSGVVYLSGIADGATVRLGVTTTAGPVVPIAESKIGKPTVVTHGAGAALVAIVVGTGTSTNLTLQFSPL